MAGVDGALRAHEARCIVVRPSPNSVKKIPQTPVAIGDGDPVAQSRAGWMLLPRSGGSCCRNGFGMLDETDDDWPEGWPSPRELREHGYVRLTKDRTPELKSRPRVAQYYWVSFPADTWEPEFYERHPAVVIRAASALNGICSVVPITSTAPASADNPFKVKLSENPYRIGRRTHPNVWAVCDHVCTVHVNRLHLVEMPGGRKGWETVPPKDMAAIALGVQRALEKLLAAPAELERELEREAARKAAAPSRVPGPNTLTLPKKPEGNA